MEKSDFVYIENKMIRIDFNKVSTKYSQFDNNFI